MKNMIFLIVLIALIGCNDEDEMKPKTFLDTHFEISYKNADGIDLLDPNYTGSFDPKIIQVYVIENGLKKVLDDNSNPNLISNERGYYSLHFSTSGDTTYLKLTETNTDTITTEWKAGTNYYYNTKMWYNGELKWEKEKAELPILIIK